MLLPRTCLHVSNASSHILRFHILSSMEAERASGLHRFDMGESVVPRCFDCRVGSG